ncbi:peptidase M16 [Kaistia sp. 32K]|uniref:M16 family metallopeptidase n=1 Tax=Kaistia sp. 32K TaxID=2795690 RepID=UPI001936CDAB|nr:peptidase M16 [Kaistia sp. 32K]
MMANLFSRASLAFVGLVLLAPVSQAMEIQRVVSPGGVEAWLVEDYAVPIIAVNFAFSGGTAQDPAAKPGVANMLSGLLDEGAGDIDSKAFQAKLDDLSISLSFDAGRDEFFGTLKTLEENKAAAFDLLALAVQKPRFDAEPVERIRSQITIGINEAKKQPESVAGDAMRAAAYPGHPYGQPGDGTIESVTAITAADLRAYHDKTFARDNLKVVVVGAIDAKGVSTMLDEVFGPLPAKADLAKIADVEPKGGNIDIDMPNPQTVIRFGGPGPARSAPDFMASFVANHILGGGTFSSRLYEEVRERRGLAYSVGTMLMPSRHSAVIVGSTATRADRAGETVDLIKSEMARLAKDGPTEDELAKAKSFLTGSYALRFDSSSKIARQLLGIALEDLGIDYVEKRNALVEAVTLEDVKQASQKMFSTGTNLVVRVGPHES